MEVSISDIFVKNNLPVVSIHTSSVIIQTNGKISHFDLGTIKESLKQNCIPLLYGEMVLDKKLGMTICSGDAIAPYLAKKLGAQKMFFASDIDGVFDKDPHLHKNARLIKKISLSDIEKKSNLTHSHNIDTTGGLLGKIKKMKEFKNSKIKTVEIFNGLDSRNYKKVLSGKSFNHTFIEI
jgi:isopentenyl phosphate kinase